MANLVYLYNEFPVTIVAPKLDSNYCSVMTCSPPYITIVVEVNQLRPTTLFDTDTKNLTDEALKSTYPEYFI